MALKQMEPFHPVLRDSRSIKEVRWASGGKAKPQMCLRGHKSDATGAQMRKVTQYSSRDGCQRRVGGTQGGFSGRGLNSAPGAHLPPRAGHRRADVLTSPRTPRHLCPQRPCRERLGFPRTEGKPPHPLPPLPGSLLGAVSFLTLGRTLLTHIPGDRLQDKE